MTPYRGLSHINLATLDLEATRDFYESVLGFRVVGAAIYKVKEGGRLRHMQFDIGKGQMLSFLEPNEVPGLPEDFPTDMNSHLGLPPNFYHLAFEAGNVQQLKAKRRELIEKNIAVTEIADHGWSQSIYFDDPVNGLKLEYSCVTRELRGEDAELTVRLETSMDTAGSMMTPVKN